MSNEEELIDHGKQERGSARVSLNGDIFLRRSGSPKVPVALLELSNTGCRVELSGLLNVGETVWVTFSSLDAIEASVVWASNFIAGLSFAAPIHPAVFDLLASRMNR